MIFGVLFLVAFPLATGEWCLGAEPSTENPIGTCACAGHLWIDAGCHQGYWCEDTTGKGCLLVNQFSYTNLGSRFGFDL